MLISKYLRVQKSSSRPYLDHVARNSINELVYRTCHDNSVTMLCDLDLHGSEPSDRIVCSFSAIRENVSRQSTCVSWLSYTLIDRHNGHGHNEILVITK